MNPSCPRAWKRVASIVVLAQVYVTGHSLGGSLANLAAYDIARALEPCPRMTRIICYTFGSPRTGNHAFARDYQRVVPDTWSIINDQACCIPLSACHTWASKNRNQYLAVMAMHAYFAAIQITQ